jgi:hypothetical protein
MAWPDDTGLTSQPKLLLDLFMAQLNAVLEGRRRGVAGDNFHPATPASAAPAAGCRYVGPGGHCRVEQRVADGNAGVPLGSLASRVGDPHLG